MIDILSMSIQTEDAGKEIDLNALASDVRAVDTALITQQQQRLNPGLYDHLSVNQ